MRKYNNKIYYLDQTNWNTEMYAELNAEINKLFLIGIEYHFSPNYLSRGIKTCEEFDKEIRDIKYNKLSEETKCIMVAILNQQKCLHEFLEIYPNLKPLLTQQPLKEKLFLSEKPFNIFPSYREMNIIY